MPDYRWRPIAPLSAAERDIDLGSIAEIYKSWRASKKRLQKLSRSKLSDFNQKLIRRLSIETGILERLYDLDRGTTEALVAHGFVEDLITRTTTGMAPAALIDILRDQEAGIQLVMDGVARKRDISKGLIHELHSILTRHQDTTTAVDQFGSRLEIPLLKGRYKEQPNNPRRPDNSIHEYCPPLQVDTEMENLLVWLSTYREYDPIVVSSWLHHRFTQIHPYQDGNGRVSRALTAMTLLQADLLPLVIDRDMRVQYIEALEIADRGDLSVLTNSFARLERAAILQALSVEADREEPADKSMTSTVIGLMADKANRRKEQDRTELLKVNALAVSLRERALQLLGESLRRLTVSVPGLQHAEVSVQAGGSDYNNSLRYMYYVARLARKVGTFANVSEDFFFAEAGLTIAGERFVFVISFHHVGRELTGVMEANAFARVHLLERSEVGHSDYEILDMPYSVPFVFTNHTKLADISEFFNKWADAVTALALLQFAERF